MPGFFDSFVKSIKFVGRAAAKATNQADKFTKQTTGVGLKEDSGSYLRAEAIDDAQQALTGSNTSIAPQMQSSVVKEVKGLVSDAGKQVAVDKLKEANQAAPLKKF